MKGTSETRCPYKTIAFITMLLLVLTFVFTGCSSSNNSGSSEPEATTASSQNEYANIEADLDKIASPSTAGSLHVEGPQLVGEHGEAVQLRGVSTHGLAWFPQYVNEEFFSELRHDWKANVVRLAMYTAESGGYCTDGDKQELKQLVKDGVAAATAADLYVVVDWHILSDGNPLQHFDEAKAFFDEMSHDFAANNNVIYEICNEPNGGTAWADIKAYAEEMIPVIRANSPEAVVVVGTPTWSQEVDKAAADPIAGTAAENVMYALHFYAATHQQDLRNRLANAIQEGLPVFVTEFGICDASGNGNIDYESADAWVALMDSLDISYICWNLSNKNEASALFKPDCNKISGFTEADLSAEGLWLQGVLSGEVGKGEGVRSAPQNEAAVPDAPSNAITDTLPQHIEGASGGLVFAADIVNSWEADGKHFCQYAGTVTNNRATADSWRITVSLGAPFTLSDSWNGRFIAEGTDLQIADAGYNGHLDSGRSVGDIGFIVYV